MATSLVLIGGQSAYITAPSVLGELYGISPTLPFLVSIVPCKYFSMSMSISSHFQGLLVTILMTILNFIPGGRTAGQVPLRFALENMAKEAKIEFVDNEIEMEVIAMAGDDNSPSLSHSPLAAATASTAAAATSTTKPRRKSKEKVQDNEEVSEDEHSDQDQNKDRSHVVVDMTVPSLVQKKWMENDMDDHENNGDGYTKKQSSNEPQSDSDSSDTMYIQFTSQHSITENTFYVQPQFDRIARMHFPNEVGSTESSESDEGRPFRRSVDRHTMENESHSEDDEIAI